MNKSGSDPYFGDLSAVRTSIEIACRLIDAGSGRNWGLTPIFFAGLVIAGCGTGGRAPTEDPQFARSIADTAARAAVAKHGARVCREMQVGIAERDWVRGVVVEVEAARVGIRIDEPGRFEHTVNGVKLTRGAIVRDDAAAWTPCL